MMSFSMLPEWACFVLTLVFVMIAHEGGFKFGIRRRNSPGANPETAAGAMSGTTVGLLAFMLAFTFNGAASDYEQRKSLIIDEANAVRTAYRRSMVMPEPQRTQTRNLLREYLDIRIGLAQNRGANLGQVIARTSAIQDELWSKALLFEQEGPKPAVAALYMTSLNEVFDIHVKRYSALITNRISHVNWYILCFLLFVTMAMLGYQVGLDGTRSIFIQLGWALAFSAVIYLIIALDRPLGIMTLSQQPLINVQMMLH
jgi:hypothetical protein